MTQLKLFISHDSALYFWRTNPPFYVLEGCEQNIRSLRNCPSSHEQVLSFHLSEAEFGERPFDVLIPPSGPRPRSFLNYHIQKAPVPPHSLYPLRDGIHIVSPALCFVQLCKSLTVFEALELGMELCGTYALHPEGLEDAAKRDYQLLSQASLLQKAETWKEIHGLSQARKVAPYLADFSASPMETKLYLLLCLPQKYGGYNIVKPELNPKLKLTAEEQSILRQVSIKPDLLWRKQRIAVEYDGEYHDDPAQRLKDDKRRIILEARGCTVLSVKKQLLYDPLAFDRFAMMLAKKCGKRLRPLTLKQQFARESLREALHLTRY